MRPSDVLILIIFVLPLMLLLFTRQSSPPSSLVLWSAMSHDWDGLAGADGIEISIRPQDADGEIVKVSGLLEAVLLSASEDVIDSWTLSIPAENYTEMYSTPIMLPYSGSHSPCEFGTLIVNFTCSGMTFSETRRNVPLGAT